MAKCQRRGDICGVGSAHLQTAPLRRLKRNSDPWRSRSSEWFVLRSTDSARTELGVERNDGIYRPRSIAFDRSRPDFHRAESLRLNAAKRGAAVAEPFCQPSEFFNTARRRSAGSARDERAVEHLLVDADVRFGADLVVEACGGLAHDARDLGLADIGGQRAEIHGAVDRPGEGV